MITVSANDAAPAMLFTTMVGIHQSVNLACALMAVRLLMKDDKSISEETMREGFARTTWTGRFEVKRGLDRTLSLMVLIMRQGLNLLLWLMLNCLKILQKRLLWPFLKIKTKRRLSVKSLRPEIQS